MGPAEGDRARERPARPGPSGWGERGAVAALAAAGLAISAYLAAVQLGVIPAAWDPIFGAESSARVLHSALARALPIPDAALGALAYAAELVADLAGGSQRWRTHPWIVVVFGVIVAGLALVGVTLIVVQAAVVRSGCTLCLCSAAASITAAIIVLAGGEVHAAVRVLAPARERRSTT